MSALIGVLPGLVEGSGAGHGNCIGHDVPSSLAVHACLGESHLFLGSPSKDPDTKGSAAEITRNMF